MDVLLDHRHGGIDLPAGAMGRVRPAPGPAREVADHRALGNEVTVVTMMKRPLVRSSVPGGAPGRLPWIAMLLVLAGVSGCGSDSVDLGPDDAVAAFVGSWAAEAFEVSSANEPGRSLDLLEGGSFTLTVEPSGHYTGILNLDGFSTLVEYGRMEVEGQTVILTPDNGPVATSTFVFDGPDRVTLDGTTEFDFDFDGTPDPAEARIVLVRS